MWFERRPRAASFFGVARDRGYTLIELVMVMVIIAILSVTILPRWVSRASFDARGYFEDVAAAARYGRNLAVASGCPVQLQVTANSYSLNRPASFCASGSFPTVVDRPAGGGSFSESAPTTISVTGAPLTVTFASDGSTDLAVDATLAINGLSMTLVAATGYVETP